LRFTRRTNPAIVAGSTPSKPPKASSNTARQKAHSRNGTLQPHSWFWAKPRSQTKLTSPAAQKPSSWPRQRSTSVLPLRPKPAM
jgi:hypothetical protein